MKLERMVEIETNDIHVGDRIRVSHYTATCQEITSIAAIFLLDQYLDKPMVMNVVDTNSGGYPESDLRKALQGDEVLDIFEDIRDYMVPFDNGDLLRLPFAGELFDKLPSWCEPDDHKQWPLMKDRRNRLASLQGEDEWGWVQNKEKASSSRFCGVHVDGVISNWGASGVIGVRPVFKISLKKEDMMTKDTIKDVLDTFNEKQRLVLYYIVGKAAENEETILDVLDTFNEKQILVLYYFVSKAVEDAKKGKTSKSKKQSDMRGDKKK